MKTTREQDLEAELKEWKERADVLQEILDNVPSMIGYWDNQLVNRYSNHAYLGYFNKTKAEIEGRHIQDLLGDDLYKKNLPYLQAALAGEAQVFERTIPLPAGGVKHTQAHYVPDARGGHIHGVFVLVFDVTPTIKASEERAKIYQQMSESYKMIALGEMAGGVAHEINTPLSVISINATLADRLLSATDLDREAMRKVISNIHRTTSRITKIVKGLLAFSKDRSNEKMEWVSVRSILDETLPFCKEKFKSRGIDFIYPDLDDEIKIRCRPIEVAQILVNLLNNSFDAVQDEDNKWIKIEVLSSPQSIDICVTDSGPRIPDEVRSKLMQPFFTTKEVGKGTGLGLSLSKGLAESQGASLSFDANTTHTCFILRFPRKET